MTFKLLFLKHFISLKMLSHLDLSTNKMTLEIGRRGVVAPCLPNQRALFMKQLKSYSVIDHKLCNFTLWISHFFAVVGSHGAPACPVGCCSFHDHQRTIWIVHILSVIQCICLGLIRKTMGMRSFEKQCTVVWVKLWQIKLSRSGQAKQGWENIQTWYALIKN